MLEELRLGVIEGRFADIVWNHAPITTGDLVKICERELGWKRTTTYTVLKRLSERGLFKNENGTVIVLMTKDEYNSIQSEKVVEDNFGGSLPAFISAFVTKRELCDDEIEEILKIIENMKRG